MGLSAKARRPVYEVLANLIRYASLHDDDPGEIGQNAVARGRKRVQWRVTDDGLVLVTDPVVRFDVPERSRVAFAGFWSSASGGDFYGSDDVPPEEFNAAGTYTLTTATIRLP